MKGTGYLLQAALIMLWWVGLFTSQQFFDAFQFPEIGPQAFNSFLAPDIIVIALLSALCAYRNSRALEFIILGGFGFATLYCMNAMFLTGGGYLSTAAMILGFCYNIFLVGSNKFFRTAQNTGPLVNGTKTILQIICVWSITLIFFPKLILQSVGVSTIPKIDGVFYLSIFLLILFSLLGLSSAYTMVFEGKGTPLPMDQTNELVTKGVYKYVRNPMAIAGVGQALAISLIYKSIPLLLYVCIGTVLWQLVVKPMEE